VRRGEEGQTAILVVGFALVLMVATGVVVDASAAYLQRTSLNTLADGAALAGADEARGRPVYAGGLGEHVPLDPALVRTAVAHYLTDLGAYDEHPGLAFTVDVEGRSVVVRLTAELDLPITVEGLTDAPVGAVGSAAVVVAE
jgi:hypothetical protein